MKVLSKLAISLACCSSLLVAANVGNKVNTPHQKVTNTILTLKEPVKHTGKLSTLNDGKTLIKDKSPKREYESFDADRDEDS